MSDQRVCLDLFAGIGGFSAAFEDAEGWEVVTVEIEDEFEPDICADVFDLRPRDLPEADVVLASPPCNTFSKAANWHDHHGADGPNTPEAREAVALVFHTVGLIRALDPDYWVMENPNGHLHKYLGEPTGQVTYCQYGATYQKPTDLWGDHPPGMEYRRCSSGDDCHQSSPRKEHEGDGNHPAEALPDDVAERSKVPYELSEEILAAVEGRSEQTTLVAATDGGKTPSLSTETDRTDNGGEDRV